MKLILILILLITFIFTINCNNNNNSNNHNNNCKLLGNCIEFEECDKDTHCLYKECLTIPTLNNEKLCAFKCNLDGNCNNFEPCTKNEHCKSKFCNLKTNYCMNECILTNTCNVDEHCLSNNNCLSNKCSRRGQCLNNCHDDGICDTKAECYNNNDCLSNKCILNKCIDKCILDGTCKKLDYCFKNDDCLSKYCKNGRCNGDDINSCREGEIVIDNNDDDINYDMIEYDEVNNKIIIKDLEYNLPFQCNNDNIDYDIKFGKNELIVKCNCEKLVYRKLSKTVGQSCRFNQECSIELYCEGTCKNKVGINENCNNNDECLDKMYCHPGSLKCQFRSVDGKFCSLAAQCLSNYCQNSLCTTQTCFPLNGKVNVKNRLNGEVIVKELKDVKIAELVQVGDNKFEPFLMNIELPHSNDANIKYHEFYKITTKSGESLLLTSEHYLHVKKLNKTILYKSIDEVNRYKHLGFNILFPTDVEINDIVLVNSKNNNYKLVESKVINIEIVQELGIVSPVTASGDIVVNNVLASIYTKSSPSPYVVDFFLNVFINPVAINLPIFSRFYGSLFFEGFAWLFFQIGGGNTEFFTKTENTLLFGIISITIFFMFWYVHYKIIKYILKYINKQIL